MRQCGLLASAISCFVLLCGVYLRDSRLFTGFRRVNMRSRLGRTSISARKRREEPPRFDKKQLQSWSEIVQDELGWVEIRHYPHGAKITIRRDDIEEPWPTPAPSTAPPQSVIVSAYVGKGMGHRDGSHSMAEFEAPTFLARGLDGSMYVTEPDRFRVRKIDGNLNVTSFAGISFAAGNNDGHVSEATFCTPHSLVVDDKRNVVYIADGYTQRIRMVGTDGNVNTLAGTGEIGGNDGNALDATFNTPAHMVLGLDENELFLTEMDGNRIRRIDLDTGEVSTISGGYGRNDGPASLAKWTRPYALAIDPQGSLYVSSFVAAVDSRIRKIQRIDGSKTKFGNVTTFVGGSHACARSQYRDGAGTMATFSTIHGLAFDSRSNLYMSDYLHHRIRKATPDGQVTTVVGTGTPGRANEPVPLVNGPTGLVADENGNIYFADTLNNVIRKFTPKLKQPPTMRSAGTAKVVSKPVAVESSSNEDSKMEVSTTPPTPKPRPVAARTSPFHIFLKDPEVQEEVEKAVPSATKTEKLALISKMWQTMSEPEKLQYAKRKGLLEGSDDQG